MKRIGLILLIIGGFALIQICIFIFYISLGTETALFLLIESLTTVFLTFTHLALALLIILERHNLSEFNIDKFTIYIFIFASFFRVRSGVAGENISLVLIAIAGLAVTASIFGHKVATQNANFQWAIKGIGAGLLIAALTIFINLIHSPSQFNVMILQNSFVFTGIKTMFYVFPNVISEEIIFRGFLWGYLRKAGWDNSKIAWLQGALFWAIHFSRAIVTPITFFVIIPLLTFVLTKLLLKSQQTFPSILSHAVVNIMSKLFYLALI